MVFDGFESIGLAYAFELYAATRYNVVASCHLTQESSDRLDPFPFELRPPIVLVDRLKPKHERRLERIVSEFTGSFRGT